MTLITLKSRRIYFQRGVESETVCRKRNKAEGFINQQRAYIKKAKDNFKIESELVFQGRHSCRFLSDSPQHTGKYQLVDRIEKKPINFSE